MEHNLHYKHVYISAMSPLQAETFGFLLAIKLANILQLQEPRFYTDNSVLASAAAATNIVPAPGHWMIQWRSCAWCYWCCSTGQAAAPQRIFIIFQGYKHEIPM
jgi:hypothetical protein